MHTRLFKLFLFSLTFIFLLVIFPCFGLTKLLGSGLVGDVNGDGVVDIIDIGIIIDNYGKTPILNVKADTNSDGSVNIIDIGIVIDNYGKLLSSSPTPSPVATSVVTPSPVSSGSYVVAAVGDMVCGSADNGSGFPCQAAATANSVSKISPSLVLVLGDNQYESGSLSDFNTYYTPTWGVFRTITRPVPGNHEYGTSGAGGYYSYFGSIASPQESGCKSNCKGYYSYDLGNWHLIALNSECGNVVGGCGFGSPQETWLRADLAKVSAGKCVLAYWHEPHYSSGHDGNTSVAAQSLPFWQDLYSAGADIVLNGHSHDYERFAQQDPSGKATPAGIREFVIGSGGRDFTGWWTTGLANSEVKNNNTFGILKLVLKQSGYDWQFISSSGINGYKNGTFTDSGSGTCH